MSDIRKTNLSKKEIFSFSLFFLFMYLTGFSTGLFIPDRKDQEIEFIKSYCSLLENENAKINRKLKSCN